MLAMYRATSIDTERHLAILAMLACPFEVACVALVAAAPQFGCSCLKSQLQQIALDVQGMALIENSVSESDRKIRVIRGPFSQRVPRGCHKLPSQLGH